MKAGRMPGIKLLGTLLPVLLLGAVVGLPACKPNSLSSTDSFRSTKRDWWFGTERTAMLLHQTVLDIEGAEKANRFVDPIERALAGVSACWYPLEEKTETLQPLIDSEQLAEIHKQYAPNPITEYAVPFNQLLMTIEHVPELRSINDSFQKQTARVLFDFPAEAAIDWVGCQAVIGALGCSLSMITPAGPVAGVAACAKAVPWTASLACSLAAGLSGATDVAKAPWDGITTGVEDAVADKVGDTFNDKQNRRTAILERLPLFQDKHGQVHSIYYDTVQQIPAIKWDEMKRLKNLLKDMGSGARSIYFQKNKVRARTTLAGKATWINGHRKNLSEAMKCKTVPELIAEDKFVASDAQAVPKGMEQELKAQGLPVEEVEEALSEQQNAASQGKSPTTGQGQPTSKEAPPNPESVPEDDHGVYIP